MKTQPRSSKSVRATRRKRNDKTHVTTTPSLPTLSLPHNDETVVVVKVLDEPKARTGGILEWMVDEPPARRLGRGQLISLKNTSGETGPGLLTAVTDLHRHWITWTISGGPTQYRLSIPVPWTAMTGVEAVAHTKHYHLLPDLPPPHSLTINPNHPLEGLSSPYDTSLSREETENLESRLQSITQKCWEWR
ncbi:hypothetical protein FOMPIDRAFT_1048514 [Fomitopsis schrenkii]|uniref:Uncharacterized protein n=1 Tax=Fomitopsis schrenkii TaxID=2126942 RepID=S8EEF4_FOMSC|nr:hypothetical protein FOMPIDRAFT_1048514 [Fomitopsis schrenkii]